MSNTSIYRYKERIAFTTVFCVIWYLIFEWPIVHYPSYAKEPCYSPNGEYYITRYQTPWQSVFLSDPIAFGTARLFDRSGKLLYEKEAYIGEEAGPTWLDMTGSDPALPSEVFYMDGGGPEWGFTLPTPPGKEIPFKKCHPKQVDKN
jgi:hypothetical protein